MRVLATGHRSKRADRGGRKLLLPARPHRDLGAFNNTVAARKGLGITTSAIRPAGTRRAVVLSLAHLLKPFHGSSVSLASLCPRPGGAGRYSVSFGASTASL